MIPTFAVVLNTSIANVALPNISASFAMSIEDASWVLTAYLVANGIVLPSTSWFCNLFGRRNFLIICTIIFSIGSIFCGMSTSLPMMIVSRVIQGLGGGALMPIAQSILLENFPHSKRGTAMAFFGLGIMVAPIVGPAMGGWITDNYSWNWIFFINVPFGLLSVILSYLYIQDPPYMQNREKKDIDYIGFSLLAVWLISQQIVLDKGVRADWFQSSWICWLTFISVTFLLAFIYWQIRYKNSIIDLSVFKDINFVAGCTITALMSAILYGTLALLPMFLQNLLKYTATLSGAVMTYRGISCILALCVIGPLSNKINIKIIIAAGFVIWAISFMQFTDLNLGISMDNIVCPNLVCGLGLGLLYTPLTTITFETLELKHMSNAAGIYNLLRNIGGSIGISVTNTLLSNNVQIHQAYLVSNLSPNSIIFQQRLHALQHSLGMHMDAVTAMNKANIMIYKSLLQQSALLAYMDVFRVYAIISIILAPTVIIFRRITDRPKGYRRRRLVKYYLKYKRKLVGALTTLTAA